MFMHQIEAIRYVNTLTEYGQELILIDGSKPELNTHYFMNAIANSFHLFADGGPHSQVGAH